MTTLVILRFLGIFAVYTGVTLALPALMFRRILRGRSLAEQFLMCYTFGNFYIINIVFLLQLLHISNFFTLAGLTAVLSIVIGGRVNRIPLKQQAGNTWHLFGKLLRGRMKLKSAIFLFLGKCAEGIKRLAKFFYRHIVKNPIQSMLLLGIGVCLCWIYGRQIILVYGYRASDIPVHMSWINEMSRGKIFAKGVYPFGFHCMIYYLHAVFRFDTYVILCQFFFAQVIFMHLVLLAMLKQLCKTKYIPYIGTFVFLLGNFWSGQTYSRFYATLPQEFGMIFVIPSIYFLIRFFQIPKQKLADKETRLTLAVLCDGVFSDTGDPFLRHDDRRTLLYRDRVPDFVFAFCVKNIFAVSCLRESAAFFWRCCRWGLLLRPERRFRVPSDGA